MRLRPLLNRRVIIALNSGFSVELPGIEPVTSADKSL
jgi:hypothetical protein